MKTKTLQAIPIALVCSCLLFPGSRIASAQNDSGDFEFIPKYYLEDSADIIRLPPPEIVHSPKILFPADPELQGKQADVWVKAMVNRKGAVSDAKVLKSTDAAFNKYAIKYAREYGFRWNEKWPDELKNQQTVWISFPVHFRE